MTFWKRPKFILWSLFFVLLVVVMLQNVEPTKIRFLFWSFLAVPKLALILISMAIGGAIALLLRWQFRSRNDESEPRVSSSFDDTNPPTVH